MGAIAEKITSMPRLWCNGLVQFNHDNMTGPLLAADLASLVGKNWEIKAANRILKEHEIRWSELSEKASEELRQWSEQLRQVFLADSEDSLCAEINALLDAGTSRVYLTTHDQLKPHMHFASDDNDVVARVKAVTAGGLAIFVVGSEGERLGGCQRPGCTEVFVDTSRNGRRAYCSAKCGNYVAVQRHRSRR